VVKSKLDQLNTSIPNCVFCLHKQVACEKSDRQFVFRNINIELHSSQLLYVTGENGAGKTSLLRILVGLSSPSAGVVEVNGFNIHKMCMTLVNTLLYFVTNKVLASY